MTRKEVAAPRRGVQRLRTSVAGAVQGVGFRPFVHRLAHDLSLTGWVTNSARGVTIEVEGPPPALARFLERLKRERPPLSAIDEIRAEYLEPAGFARFEIRESEATGEKTAVVLPDVATCPDCLREIFDPADRRHLYPFTNCTNCGPRYSILERLPYDRPNTTMKRFVMCPECRSEYEDPRDRRFHAQPNACPACGPQLELWDASGATLDRRDDALRSAAHVIRSGQILGVKGLGGFQLMVDARDGEAVARLRRRKHREEKPFALMFPAMEAVERHCRVSPPERQLLLSPQAPIVLLDRRRDGEAVAEDVAPGNPCLGVMLPYSPLHHLLMRELGFPIVATSGNLSDEPIVTDEREAIARLGAIADRFLVHDRPIFRHVDDSVARVMMGRPQILRRARGYAPAPIHLAFRVPRLLAVGAHLKNTVATSVDRDVFVGQHIGDLETAEARSAFERTIASLEALHELRPDAVACDLHPDYHSTRFARRVGRPVVPVQHHLAHVASCMAEHGISGPALGISWDGTGYGTDGTVWGGELILVKGSMWRRAGHLREFRLVGGEAAVREPRRAAIGLLHETYGSGAFEMDWLQPLRETPRTEREAFRRMLERRIASPLTSSVGRLFDAVAALLGIRGASSFEGQAAMELEFAIGDTRTDESLPMIVRREPEDDPSAPLVIDWEPTVRAVVDGVGRGEDRAGLSARFHNALAEAIVSAATHLGEADVVLTGGCFQNRYLTRRAVERLEAEGFRAHWHERVPPNDGGVALGQIAWASRLLETE
jgi:hydrogenase maturation protein HypF